MNSRTILITDEMRENYKNDTYILIEKIYYYRQLKFLRQQLLKENKWKVSNKKINPSYVITQAIATNNIARVSSTKNVSIRDNLKIRDNFITW